MTKTSPIDKHLRDELCDTALKVADQAARLIYSRCGTQAVIETKSSTTDLVTEVDKASETLIVGLLKQLRPQDAVLGEEGSQTESENGIRWIIDPIDGTTSWVYGQPGYTVSVAVEQHGQTIAGCVIQPSTGFVYLAKSDVPARWSGLSQSWNYQDRKTTQILASERFSTLQEQAKVRTPVSLSKSLIGTGFSTHRETRCTQATITAKLLPQIADIRRHGSAAQELCYVASGQLDGFFEHHLKPWDYAAGLLIAKQAGARTIVIPHASGAENPDRSPAVVFAASPAIADELLEALGGYSALKSFADRSTQ